MLRKVIVMALLCILSQSRLQSETCEFQMSRLRDVLDRFADSTSMHGVPKAIKARSVAARSCWIVVCVLAGSMFGMQMFEVLKRYYSYPKKVTIEVVATPVAFPAISLCNFRNLDVHVLNQVNRMFIKDPEPANHINSTNQRFVSDYMKIVAKYARLWYTYQDNFPEVFQDIFSRTTMSANIEESVIEEAAVQLEGFIVSCQYAGRSCNITDRFKRFFDSYYFNCFTYEPAVNERELSEGIENGWSSILLSGSGMLDKNDEIRMLPGLHESRSPMSASEGVRVVIHRPGTRAYPFTEGYDVPTGFSASFGVQPRRNIRIGPPHGNCSKVNPFGEHGEYRLMSCQKMCIQKFVEEECNCSDNALPLRHNSDKPLCRNDDLFPKKCISEPSEECLQALLDLHSKIECARKMKGRLSRNSTALESCMCFPACDEVTYDVSYSLSKWPAAGYEGDATYWDVFGIGKFVERFNRTTTIVFIRFQGQLICIKNMAILINCPFVSFDLKLYQNSYPKCSYISRLIFISLGTTILLRYVENG
ncbi:DgyrCDS8157 [Dimorphilus gyrociliatus]|uniref:DgyrCDS8157 n=1 Tax=Dimorphilus gyrociliatus TaxID=2664684 RepID=A0A7I8VVL5_9ANNE|nr:DgyrCDS8157 [Dimorphilus gyrociliatus]